MKFFPDGMKQKALEKIKDAFFMDGHFEFVSFTYRADYGIEIVYIWVFKLYRFLINLDKILRR